MKESYLEVTFRRGRALAAYYYLPRTPRQKSFRVKRLESGMPADLDRRGRLIGIEITAPGQVSLAAMNRVLGEYGSPLLSRSEFRPLRAA